MTGTTVGTLWRGPGPTWSSTLASITTAGFDPTQVIQVGVQIGTGTGPEGGVFPTTG